MQPNVNKWKSRGYIFIDLCDQIREWQIIMSKDNL